MTVSQALKKYPNLVKINEVNINFSTLEEYASPDKKTYLQVIDDEIMVLEYNEKYIINNL